MCHNKLLAQAIYCMITKKLGRNGLISFVQYSLRYSAIELYSETEQAKRYYHEAIKRFHNFTKGMQLFANCMRGCNIYLNLSKSTRK